MSKPEWISVKDRMPSRYQHCIIHIQLEEDCFWQFMSQYDDSDEDGHWQDGHGPFYHDHLNITHWMPMPDPPESPSK